MIKSTIIKWGRATHSNDPTLIREMFKLIYNQYDGIGEVNTHDRFPTEYREMFRFLDVLNERTSSMKNPFRI